jgi:hypothetical protein
MDKSTRNAIERATQQARMLLDDDFSLQLEGTFDVLRSGVISPKGGAHLLARQHFHREKIIAAIEHKRAAGTSAVEAITDYVRDAAFTTLNRFVALKMLEARELVQECITKGEQSAGYKEFCGMAPGVALLPDATGYRLYVESLFDEFSTEIKVLFDRRDAASVLWPKRQTFDALLSILNASDLSGVWGEDETIGWVYQFFNSGEERKKMRDESQAPRNSRELAVRNQFFTPRYVVQFLVDNTLGRIWLEMHGEHTRLADLCQYFVPSSDDPGQPRPRKDPRDLRILDPACGSGHFLLYSFDLLLTIYEEAWSAAGAALRSEVTGRSLQDDYPDIANLRRAAPRLIIERNLHGVDIDPRCAQIAALALWLRAQRAWKDVGIAASDRPRIQRTHIVVAEPMPGDAILIDEFAACLDPPLLRDLFKKMVDESRLAGELGALLRVEDGLAAELLRAREQFVKQRQTSGFLPGMEPVAKQDSLDLSGIDDDHFFHEAEARIIEALREFAETATGSANWRRQLFVGDAVQGVALIDLIRTRFDVVLMNPPFGAPAADSRDRLATSFPSARADLYAAFVVRAGQLVLPKGFVGALTNRTGYFLGGFASWRDEVLYGGALACTHFADLGSNVLDNALVEVAAVVLKSDVPNGASTFDVKREVDKSSALRHEAKNSSHRASIADFASIPGKPFCYWAAPPLLKLYHQLPDTLEPKYLDARLGLRTLDDFRFVRLAWEHAVSPCFEKIWVSYLKGGPFSRFYADVWLKCLWANSGRELKAHAFDRYGSESRTIQAQGYYFRPGLTYTRRTSSGFSVRAATGGCNFSDKGPLVVAHFDDHRMLLALMGLLNSSLAEYLIKLGLAAGDGAARSYEVGLIQRLPAPVDTRLTTSPLCSLALSGWKLKRSLDTTNETSHAFVTPALLQASGSTAALRATAWLDHLEGVETELTAILTKLDDECFELYGIAEDDRKTINKDFEEGLDGSIEASATNINGDENEDKEDQEADAGPSCLASDFLSWSVGVAFGRFDVRLATGARLPPIEPQPFDPLPMFPPGMLTGENGLPLPCAPVDYPVAFPENGILVDDRGHASDISTAVQLVFDVVFGATADDWRNAVGALVDAKNFDLKIWLASDFFDHHLKRYSKSRRKAPILWQLAVPSSRYSCWLYAHRVARDSLFQVQNDLVAPKLSHEARQLTSMVDTAGANPSAKDRKEIAEQEALVGELRSFLEEVKRVAPLWNPRIDDGIALTMAPLWRLVPQHKPWQKELKTKWDDLANGKYDWAHVAMHLWPERVVPKCLSDRSIAIAHGLEDVFWVEADDGKWKPRPTPKRRVDDLVGERTSVAVKSALKGLTEASVPNGPKARSRKSAS